MVIALGRRFKSRVSVVVVVVVHENVACQSPPFHERQRRARCGHWAKHHVSHKVCPRRGRFAKHHVVLIFLRRAPKPELVIAIAEWMYVTRTAPHCGRGSLRMANQVATGAGNAFAYGTGAGGSLRMANQVSPRSARLRKQMLQRSAAPRPKEGSKHKKVT